MRTETRITPETVIAQVCSGDSVEFLEQYGEWFRIRVIAITNDCVPDRVAVGTEGWVSGTLLTAPIAEVPTSTMPTNTPQLPTRAPTTRSYDTRKVLLLAAADDLDYADITYINENGYQTTVFDATPWVKEYYALEGDYLEIVVEGDAGVACGIMVDSVAVSQNDGHRYVSCSATVR